MPLWFFSKGLTPGNAFVAATLASNTHFLSLRDHAYHDVVKAQLPFCTAVLPNAVLINISSQVPMNVIESRVRFPFCAEIREHLA